MPDLPGCNAAAETREEVERFIREGIALSVATLREQGRHSPSPPRAIEVALPVGD